MKSHSPIEAKATTPETRSDAIVVSFGNYWYAHLRNKSFSAVLRKRVPVNMCPSLMYIHINSPKSAICARAVVSAVDYLDLTGAVNISDALGLSRPAIESYIGKADSIGVYRIKEIQFPKIEATTAALSARMRYHPPQSFFVLSRNGQSIIDGMCGFAASAVFSKRSECA